jgi:hypothetical protein
MTRALFALLAVAGMAGLTGCASTQKSCGSLGHGAGCASSDCAETTGGCESGCSGGCESGCSGGCGGSCSGGCGSCGYDPCNIFSSGCGMLGSCGTQCGSGCGQSGRGTKGGAFGMGGGMGGGRRTPRGWDSQRAMVSGPATGAVTYPYYTVRGPRDFLTLDSRPIGP